MSMTQRPMRALKGEPRFPIQPLIDKLGWSRSRVLKRFGWTTDTWRRAEAQGGLPLCKADEWCCALGMHPVEVWGDLWWTINEEECR